MARAPISGAPLVDTGIAKPGPAVVAQPVNTFVAPPQDSQALQLARALGQFAPSLAALGNTIQEKKNENQLAAGAAEATRLHLLGLDYAKEVKAGRLPANASPFFLAGLHEIQGRNAAETYAADLEVAVNNNEQLKTATSMDDYRSFVTQWSADWFKSHNVEQGTARFLKGFSGQADAVAARQEQDFASKLNSRTVNQAAEAITLQMRHHVIDSLAHGTPLEDIAKGFKNSQDLWIGFLGANGAMVNDAQINGALQAAEEMSRSADPLVRLNASKVYDLLKLVPGGPRGAGTLAERQSRQRDIQNSWLEIANNRAQMDAQDRQQAAAQKAKDVESVYRDMQQASLGADGKVDPNFDVTPYVVRMGNIDPSQLSDIKRYRDFIREAPYDGDPRVYSNTYARIWLRGDVTHQDLAQLAFQHLITVPQSIELGNQLDARESGGSERGPLKDTELLQYLNNIPARFAADPTKPIDPTLQDNRDHYESFVMSAYYQWRTSPEGQSATTLERLAFLQKLSIPEVVNQWRQGPLLKVQGSTITQPHRAELNPADWYSKALLPPDQLIAMRTAVRNHQRLTPQMIAALVAIGVDEDHTKEFLNAQAQFAKQPEDITPP